MHTHHRLIITAVDSAGSSIVGGLIQKQLLVTDPSFAEKIGRVTEESRSITAGFLSSRRMG